MNNQMNNHMNNHNNNHNNNNHNNNNIYNIYNNLLYLSNFGKSLYINSYDCFNWLSFFIGIPLYQKPGIIYEWEIHIKKRDNKIHNDWIMVFGIEEDAINIKNNRLTINTCGSGFIFNNNEKVQNSLTSEYYHKDSYNIDSNIIDTLNKNGCDNDKIKVRLSFPHNFPESYGKLSFYKNNIHLGVAYDNIFSKNGYFFPSISCIGCNEISVKLIKISIQ
jgi:hypothetical protein